MRRFLIAALFVVSAAPVWAETVLDEMLQRIDEINATVEFYCVIYDSNRSEPGIVAEGEKMKARLRDDLATNNPFTVYYFGPTLRRLEECTR